MEILSSNWNHVREHLNRVARLPAYRFHMREIIFILLDLFTAENANRRIS